MVALNRARLAWERTQPQLVIDGWADGLDEADRGKPVGLVEPVASPPADAAADRAAGSHPKHEGDGANLVRVARRPRKGA
jgi:hypothetical protein